MFTDWLRRVFGGIISAIVASLARLGVHPNTLTIAGCLLQLGVGGVLGAGHLRLGGILLAATSVLDAFDGALARQRFGATRFGAFLDSCLDRVAEAGVLIGLGWYYLHQPGQTPELLIYVALAGSLLVSYARARAEGLGIRCRDGLFTRVERTLLLVIGLVAGWVIPVLWILAIGTVLTALHRMVRVYLQVRDDPIEQAPTTQG
ncbi:MAG: CDP-alcohol phosphatidyltransferase family protein [Chloroflexi bacterium]|nr:CDP-alcohol phosphatidyltransferase family protein [Chloroflexota bacterium]